MSKRKTTLKKQNLNRHLIIKTLREGIHIKNVVDKKGNLVALNFMKHYLYKAPFANQEYNREMARFIRSNIDRQKQINKQKIEVENSGRT